MKTLKKLLKRSFLALLVLFYYSSSSVVGMGNSTSSSSSSSSTTNVTLNQHPHAGLINNSNTCFMNATFQVLTNIQPFTDILEQSAHHRTELTTNFIELKNRLLQEINPISTLNFIQAANNAKISSIQQYLVTEFINPKTKQLEKRKNNQQDAAEFLTQFLDKICQENSALTNIFSFTQESHLVCKKCHFYSVNQNDLENLLTLQITPPNTPSTPLTLNDLFTKYTEKEILGSNPNDDYYCSHHNPTNDPQKKSTAIKYLKIPATSQILMISLKRFDYNWNTNITTKITTPVQFPSHNLDLTQLGNNQNIKYDLIGFICHSGTTANSGHYTSYIKDYRNNRWYFCNDSQVTEQTGQQVEQATLSTKATPYILFYQRQTPPIQTTTFSTSSSSTSSTQPTGTSANPINLDDNDDIDTQHAAQQSPTTQTPATHTQPQVQPQPQAFYKKAFIWVTKILKGLKRDRDESNSSLTPPAPDKKPNTN